MNSKLCRHNQNPYPGMLTRYIMQGLLLALATTCAYTSQLPKEYLAVEVHGKYSKPINRLPDLRTKSARAQSSGTCSKSLLGVTVAIPVGTLFTYGYYQVPAACQVSKMHHRTQFFCGIVLKRKKLSFNNIK